VTTHPAEKIPLTNTKVLINNQPRLVKVSYNMGKEELKTRRGRSGFIFASANQMSLTTRFFLKFSHQKEA